MVACVCVVGAMVMGGANVGVAVPMQYVRQDRDVARTGSDREVSEPTLDIRRWTDHAVDRVSDGRWIGRCSGWQYGEFLQPAEWGARGERMMKRLVVCVFGWFGVGAEHALYVADRESHFYPWAFNVGGCDGSGCAGMFQHVMS